MLNPLMPPTAYGDPDDAYRLCAELASIAEQRGPTEASRLCLSPHSSWAQRAAAIESLLDESLLDGLRFIDIDALYQGEIDDETRWNDQKLKRERAELYQILVRAGVRHGWTFIRPLPSAPLFETMLKPGPSPELWKTAEWLEAKGILSRRAWPHLTMEDIDHAVLAGLSDTLSAGLETAATQLALLRPPQLANGAIGPFPRTLWNILSDSFQALVERGIVHLNENLFQMPRRIRQHFLAKAQIRVNLPALHAYLAGQSTDPYEQHFHAIAGGNIELAKQSAHHYTNDLRLLTFQLTAQSHFREAASIYDFIRAADPKDAYAQEYYGWCLWRAGDFFQNPDQRTAIEQAYQQACLLERGNPLYHGRWLGFRAECGQSIVVEFRQRTRQMEQEGRSERSIAWFAQAVLGGMERGRREQDLKTIEKDFGKIRVKRWKSSSKEPLYA